VIVNRDVRYCCPILRCAYPVCWGGVDGSWCLWAAAAAWSSNDSTLHYHTRTISTAITSRTPATPTEPLTPPRASIHYQPYQTRLS
jgi:hypothetical protein